MYRTSLNPMTIKDIKTCEDLDRLYIEQTIINNACKDQRTCANCDYKRRDDCLGTMITERILELTWQEFEDKVNDPNYMQVLSPKTIKAMEQSLAKREETKKEAPL